MKRCIAERKLLYSLKGSDAKCVLTIRIDATYSVEQEMVDFPIGEGLVGCHIETEGLEKEYMHEAYGVDEIQAINIASNIEPLLERLSKKYDFYWLSGEPYFEEQDRK